jgi:hypothetical protein
VFMFLCVCVCVYLVMLSDAVWCSATRDTYRSNRTTMSSRWRHTALQADVARTCKSNGYSVTVCKQVTVTVLQCVR